MSDPRAHAANRYGFTINALALIILVLGVFFGILSIHSALETQSINAAPGSLDTALGLGILGGSIASSAILFAVGVALRVLAAISDGITDLARRTSEPARLPPLP